MITQPVRLSDVQNGLLALDEADKYYIKVAEGTKNILVSFGQDARTSLAKFTHPNILKTVKRIHEFKHYSEKRGKWWTSKPGLDFYVAIPREHIEIQPHKGYSYIKVKINGVDVTFNVGGGTNAGADTWTDYLDLSVHTFVGMGKRAMQAICDVAVTNDTDFDLSKINELEPSELEHWEKMVAQVDGKAIVLKAIDNGELPKIKLALGLSYGGQDELQLKNAVRKTKYLRDDKGNLLRDEQNQPKIKQLGYTHFICGNSIYDNVKVKKNQIDWQATANLLEDEAEVKDVEINAPIMMITPKV